MSVCKKCNNSFKIRQLVDGKIRNFKNRKYCLDCSPFNKHNTKKLEINVKKLKLVSNEKLCKCEKCGREYIYKKNGNTLKKCNSCLINRKRLLLKEKAIKYKGNKCQRCGYDKCNRSLTFHHLNSKDKKFNISGNHTRKWELVKEELDKCILLCANCHTELHDGMWEIQ